MCPIAAALTIIEAAPDFTTSGLANVNGRLACWGLLRLIDRFVDLDGLRRELAPFYSEMGRPSIDPELMIRILIVGYCFGIRSERRLWEEVHLNLAYRWFCSLGLDGAVPDHSTFSKNRHGRFRESDLLRRLFERSKVPVRKISHSIYDGARDLAREIAKTEPYQTSRRQRKKVELLFAHLKRILKLDRLRLRGPNGARDEFHLAATAQNLRKLAKLIPAPTPILAA